DDAHDESCCLIVLDPKRDLADKALSVVPGHRRVWILDLAEPEIGINPLLIPARPDAVADAVVEGFRDTNEDGAIMASSDRYLRQAAIGALVLAHEEERMPTMGDLSRLLRCLDGALSDQQQKPESDRVRVALKVDEAHLLLSPTFARMLAVHRSAGLEAMCAWQQLSQIKDLAVREATTNLLQNRIVFRMNNPEDARAEIGVMMSAYTDLFHGSREARELTRFQPDMLVN